MEIIKAFIRKKSTRLMQKLAANGFEWTMHDEYYERCLGVIKDGNYKIYFPCTVKEAKSRGCVDFGKDEFIVSVWNQHDMMYESLETAKVEYWKPIE